MKKQSIRYHLICLLVVLAPTVGAAQSSQQLLLLPESRYLRQEPALTGRNDDDYRVSLDILYALDADQWRFFAEYVATNDKRTLARLHLGYETRAGTSFWLGRFDMNQGYWNKTFHFRNYIQPGIMPPGIAGFEREGGVIPAHFSGVAAKQRWSISDRASLQLEAGFGTGTRFDGRRLEAYDLLDPDGGRKPSTSLRLTYQPDAESDNEFGVFFTDNRMPMVNTLFSQNTQRVIGAYANRRFGALRLYGTLYGVGNDLDAPASGGEDDHFYSGWLQADYRIDRHWMPYTRIEHSNGDRSDAYLSLFPAFVRNRQLIGLRLDFLGNQAIKFEYARTDFLRENSNQWAAQWSMIFP